MRFRVLVDECFEGAFNMAVDETLFRSAADAEASATVRLYGFQPATVTFGYRQKPGEGVDLARCCEHGVDWVRRPTGGRALLHQHELTYAVAAPLEGAFRGLGVRALYDSVGAAIRSALARLGIPLDPVERASTPPREPALSVPCLAFQGRHEIASGGRKIVASAQRRGRRSFLQHGSILRRVDARLWTRLALHPGTPLRAVGIDELGAPPIPEPVLRASLLQAFEELFGARAEPGELSRDERASVAGLLSGYRSLTPFPQVDNVEAV